MAAEHETEGHRSADDLVVGLTGARFGGAAGRRSRAAAQPEEADSVATHHYRGEQRLVGQTGARFSGGLRRWRRAKQDAEVSESAVVQDIDQPAKSTGAQLLPQATPLATESLGAETAEWLDWSDWEASRETDGLVRPYFWTGGRTASRFDLSLETLVSATGQSPDPRTRPEHRTILALCGHPRSVAELAALMSVPLAVARVVLGDMAQAGSVVVHRTAGSADAVPDLDLMRRVLDGLQRL